jgi:Rrf2 family nitric oxide-sensitive transcriptional repressor
LIEHDYVKASRGKYGGIYLSKPAEDINAGDVVRVIEPSLCLFECFDRKNNVTCPLLQVCQLKVLLHDALRAFMKTLDAKTLADLVRSKDVRKKLITI